MVARNLSIAACLVLLLAVNAGSQVRHKDASKSGSRANRSHTPKGPVLFLDQKKPTPPRREWTREIVARSAGKIEFTVSSSGPFGVTLVTDKAYRAVLRRDSKALNPTDILLTIDSKAPTFSGTARLSPGHYWFILENQTDKQVVFHLKCYGGG